MTVLVWVECSPAGAPSARGVAGLAFGQRLAGELGLEVAALLVGVGAEDAARHLETFDLARVVVCESEKLAPYTPEPWRDVMLAAVEATGAGWLLAAHAYRSFDLLPAVAERLDAAWIPEVDGFRRGSRGGTVELRRPLQQGRLRAWVRSRRATTVVTVGAVAEQQPLIRPDPRGQGGARAESLGLGSLAESKREVIGFREPDGDLDLSAASRLVAVGRGLGAPDRLGPIEELARCLDAELAGSRPVIDAGWLERDRQVGSSGQTVSPDLYVALGISGAMQHLQGMSGSRCVVAINKDPSAPIFQAAQFGIVADLHELVPALIEALGQGVSSPVTDPAEGGGED